MSKGPPTPMKRSLVVAPSQDRWRRSANSARGVSVDADGRTQEWPELRSATAHSDWLFSSQVRCLRATASQRRIECLRAMFSASQASHASFHAAIGQLIAARVCEKLVGKLKIPRLTTRNNKPTSRKQQHQCWWVQSAISVPAKMTVIAAGVERQVPEWRSGPLPEVGVRVLLSAAKKCPSFSCRE